MERLLFGMRLQPTKNTLLQCQQRGLWRVHMRRLAIWLLVGKTFFCIDLFKKEKAFFI